ncbi:MAG TPA: histidinol phosphate phosphatase [Acidimicrobiaceae bacterium]|nr:histidinol phosphate phosphatase [Acidimicrobiaceae bacterium]HCV35299.1 histidinol phosphate phosphatase [Acidimicrobiaceae bacterium]
MASGRTIGFSSVTPALPPVSQDLVDFAVSVAREAGELTLELFRSPGMDVEGKDDGSPVTIADRRAERLLRERISSAYPNDSIVGEEEGDQIGDSGRTWIVDPIDGTVSFIQGVPLYGNLVALEDVHGPAVGVINIPALDECIWAGRGLGCYANGVPTRVRDREDLNGAFIVTSGVDYWGSAARMDPLIKGGALIRTWGDSYGYVLVATGRADAMVDPIVNRWDVAPMLTILPEAGGIFTDMAGNITAEGGDAIATNLALHNGLLAMVGR